jgi:hypothetical protein
MIKNKKIVVVMPAYNAARTLRATVSEIPRLVDEVPGAMTRWDQTARSRRLGLKTSASEISARREPEDCYTRRCAEA